MKAFLAGCCSEEAVRARALILLAFLPRPNGDFAFAFASAEMPSERNFGATTLALQTRRNNLEFLRPAFCIFAISRSSLNQLK